MRFDALEQRLRQTERALESAGELARQRNDALHLLEQRLAAQETKLSESDARGAAAEARLVATEARLAATEKRLSELAEKRASSEAQAAAEALALVRLRMAALAGNAFGPELKALESMHDTGAGDDAASLETLRSVAQRGAPVLSALQARFGGLAREALRQAQQAAAQSLWERIYARMTSLVLLRRTGDVAGDEPDAVLARAELRLKNNDLAGALAEVKKLGGPARAVLEPWIEEAQHRLDLEAALAMLEARALARLGGR